MSSAAYSLDVDDFDPGPPNSADDAAEDHGSFARGMLEQAARGDALVFALELAVSTIRNNAGNLGVISIRLRDELLRSLPRAHVTAAASLPEWCSRERIARGMHAVAGLVVLWAEPVDVRKQRDSLITHEFYAYAKMLLNDLNTLRLEQDLKCRREGQEEALWIDQALEAVGG